MAPRHRLADQPGVLEARTGMPADTGLDAAELVRLVRAARRAAATAHRQSVA